MQHKIVLDVRISSNLSDQGQDDVATRVFRMLNDFCAVVRERMSVLVDATMYSSPTNPVVGDKGNLNKVQDLCSHAFEIVEDLTGVSTYVRCVKCGSRFLLDDDIPEGSHRHMLNFDVDTGEITCLRCNDIFDTDLDSDVLTCRHEFKYDNAKKIVCCTLCDAVYDVPEEGEIELEPEEDAASPAPTIDNPVPKLAESASAPPYEDGLMD